MLRQREIISYGKDLNPITDEWIELMINMRDKAGDLEVYRELPFLMYRWAMEGNLILQIIVYICIPHI